VKVSENCKLATDWDKKIPMRTSTLQSKLKELQEKFHPFFEEGHTETPELELSPKA
jgi:hypothetical protein